MSKRPAQPAFDAVGKLRTDRERDLKPSRSRDSREVQAQGVSALVVVEALAERDVPNPDRRFLAVQEGLSGRIAQEGFGPGHQREGGVETLLRLYSGTT